MTLTNPGSGELAISVHGLRKSYGDLQAVKGIDLEVQKGQIFALLGPNGAGKTTTVEILEGYRNRDAGDISVLGFDPVHHRNELKMHIGIVLQSTGIDRYLSVAETITMVARYFPSPLATDDVISLVGLEEKRDSRVLQLSGGQQRRLDVAIALVGDPELLFLDEPTTGFDPTARRGAWEVIKNLTALGKTVLLTTHYMDEAQFLADEVAVIAGGTIVAQGPPSSLGGRDRARPMIRLTLPELVTPPAGLGDWRSANGRYELAPDNLTSTLHQLTTWAVEHRVSLEELDISRPSLEDAYLALTGSAETPTPETPVRSRRGRR